MNDRINIYSDLQCLNHKFDEARRANTPAITVR